MAVAIVLDPRYKMKFLCAMFTEIYGAEGMARELKNVKDLIIDLVKVYQGSMEGFGATDAIGAASNSSTIQSEGDGNVFDIFDNYLSSEPVMPSSFVSTELDLYMEDKNAAKNNETGYHQLLECGGGKISYFEKNCSRYHGNSCDNSGI
ncbi:hypothetical protein ACP70R_042411 [Stipagrostis hirtigluma subsp. patula]